MLLCALLGDKDVRAAAGCTVGSVVATAHVQQHMQYSSMHC
jgi:hypothetical protein